MCADTGQSFSLIQALMQPEQFKPPVTQCNLIETHISWVILAGSYAYKIKKPLNLGFLDFSSLEKRRFYCQEELRLNKRIAPETYLSVEPITGSVDTPRWGGEGEPIEYAVKMRVFPQESQLDRVLEAGLLEKDQLATLAKYIAHFHAATARAGQDDTFGTPETIQEPVKENFSQIREHVRDKALLQTIGEIKTWSNAQFQTLYPLFIKRKKDGYIRECHGDLHLKNMSWVENNPLVFDCIEFSPQLRWIDVISDVAFLVMDLQEREQWEFAFIFLNRYLEQTGDYSAIPLLKYYLVYRAMVRAKVEAIRMDQPEHQKGEKLGAEKSFLRYLNLIKRSIRQLKSHLIITRGMSASGKSTVSESLLAGLGAIRIRSDVERKRLHGLQPNEDGTAAEGKGIYCSAATEKTYRHLAELAGPILGAGYPVIIDGVFLHYRQRQIFADLARKKGIPFTILECTADIDILRQRIISRKAGVSDAGLDVLEMQYEKWEELDEQERSFSITVDTAAAVDVENLLLRLNRAPADH